MMSPEAFLAWGWRVPFLVSVVLVGVGLYVRLRIAETPVFRELLERQERSPAPVREAFGTGRREILLVGGTLAAVFGGGYIGTVYVTSYATAVLKVPLSTMFGIGVVAGLVLAGVVAVAAIGSDRFGRRRMILAGNLVMIVVGMVAFPLMDTGVVALVGLGLCLILAASGIGLGPAAAYLPELFATRHRCTGAGSAYALAAVVGGALPPVLAPIVQASLGSIGGRRDALGARAARRRLRARAARNPPPVAARRYDPSGARGGLSDAAARLRGPLGGAAPRRRVRRAGRTPRRRGRRPAT